MHKGVGKQQFAPLLENHWNKYDSLESSSSSDCHALDVRGQWTLSMDDPSDVGRMSWRLSGHLAPVALQKGNLTHWSQPDENQLKVAFYNEEQDHSPSHLKFFLLIFAKDKAQAQEGQSPAKPKDHPMKGKAKF